MSVSKIKKMNFSKAFRQATKESLVENEQPPAELKQCGKSSSSSDFSGTVSPESLLNATIDGRECRLPFEVLEQTPAEVPHVDETGITRLPFRCPVGGCGQSCSLLMFTTHICFDHTDVLLENLWPGETNSVLIDALVPVEASLPRCHKLYLVSGKVRGLGEGKHRNKLPFALMSSKVTLHDNEWMILWVTGPDAGADQRQRYTVEAGRNGPRRLLPYAVAFSGEIVPLHSSQDAKDVHCSGAGLVIPVQQVEFLADRETKLLEVCIHFH